MKMTAAAAADSLTAAEVKMSESSSAGRPQPVLAVVDECLRPIVNCAAWPAAAAHPPDHA